MLVSASICPHSPILIPSIGRDNLDIMDQSVKALQKINQEYIKKNIETIILITPHMDKNADFFGLLAATQLIGDFSDFGDIATRVQYINDTELTHQIYDQNRTEFNIEMLDTNRVDYGAAVPLYYINKNLGAKIVVIGYSYGDYQEQVDFGVKLKDIILNSNKKIALVASGDLSHCLTQNAPGGYCPSAKGFDQGLIETLKNKKTDQIFDLDQDLIDEVAECGLRSILILLGVIRKMNYSPEFLAYQSPFGVGYLTMNFELDN